MVIDDGIAVVYRAPRSYTGEDTVEISCHGGILLTERVLEAAFSCGAEPARRGEFTQRAFTNGKLDLTEAEAVIGLIDAESDEKLRLSVSHANGVLKRRTEEIYREIVALLSSVYVKTDYPEEDLAELGAEEIAERLGAVSEKLSDTLKTYRHGKAVSDGVKTAIVGKPERREIVPFEQTVRRGKGDSDFKSRHHKRCHRGKSAGGKDNTAAVGYRRNKRGRRRDRKNRN